jgi:hypothetical protein
MKQESDSIGDRYTEARARKRHKWRSGSGNGSATGVGNAALDEFFAYRVQHNFIFAPTGDMWPAASVNAHISPIPLVDANGQPVLDEHGNPKRTPAASWLDRNRYVEQMTWAPGEPMIVRDRMVSHGGWSPRPKHTVFNRYRPPQIKHGNAAEAERWLDHVRKVYPDDADHIIKWLAQRVQRPQEKVNHALVLGGLQGIGKDTLLEPAKRAVGHWNFEEVSPQHLLGRFNGFLKSVILRVNEARDLGEVNRYQFYDHLKAYTATPPDTLRVDEKNAKEYYIFNCCGLILTSNHKTAGIYLPADDRRHYVAWSSLSKGDFVDDYWPGMWHWYDHGGDRHVAAYLAELDISEFDAKAPPPKTAAFWEIVDACRAPEDAELADAIDALSRDVLREDGARLDALTLDQVASHALGDFATFLRDHKNARQIPHRFEDCGYVAVRNDSAKDGLWRIDGRRQVIYAKDNLSPRDRIAAAYRLARHA